MCDVAVAKPRRDKTLEDYRQTPRVVRLRGANRPTAAMARPPHTADAALRGESSAGAGLSLTLAFLIAGAVIVAALAFWSGPEEDRSSVSVQPPDSAVPVR